MSGECTTETCSTHEADGDCCPEMPEKLLCLADEAWMELMKDKIKAEIEKTNGEHMNKIAKLVAETNCTRWGHMIEGKVKCNEYKENLKALMTEGCDK